MKSKVHAANREEWRSWLEKNHANAEEIWLVYYKKHTGKPSVEYTDSVEEALCFGWIDGLMRSINEEKYKHRFTPRRADSRWSTLNIKLARKMIEEGRMTPAGREAFNRRVSYDEELPLTPELEKALRANKKAWENFNNLAPGYRKHYVGWLRSAKKKETRERRLKEAIKLLSQNKKLGMK